MQFWKTQVQFVRDGHHTTYVMASVPRRTSYRYNHTLVEWYKREPCGMAERVRIPLCGILFLCVTVAVIV